MCPNLSTEIQQIVGRERRGRVSQLACCGGGCFDSRRRVNSNVRRSWLLFMRLIFLIALVTLVTSVAHAQTPWDICRVTKSVWSISEKLGTGLYVFDDFRPVAFDQPTDRSFKDKESNLTMDAHVEYGDFNAAEKRKPIEIHLTLDVFNKERKGFAAADDSVSARTTYGKRWGTLTVEKRVTIGDNVYAFGLTCDDGTKTRKRSRSHLRTPNKSLDASGGSVFLNLIRPATLD
jgi:hypothetical protein